MTVERACAEAMSLLEQAATRVAYANRVGWARGEEPRLEDDALLGIERVIGSLETIIRREQEQDQERARVRTRAALNVFAAEENTSL